MTSRLALQPTSGDPMVLEDQVGPVINSRDRVSDVEHLVELNDLHKAAKHELTEAQRQLDRANHHISNYGHATSTLNRLIEILEHEQDQLSDCAILKLPHAAGGDDPAVKAHQTALELRCELLESNKSALGKLRSSLDHVKIELSAANDELPTLESRQRNLRRHEEKADTLYRDHLSLMHQSEQHEQFSDALFDDMADWPSPALPSDGNDDAIQDSPQMPVQEVFVPPATPPAHGQSLVEDLPIDPASLRSAEPSASENYEEGELRDIHLGCLPAQECRNHEEEGGELSDDYNFPEPSDASRPLHRIGDDLVQSLPGPGTSRPGPRRPYQPPRPGTVSVMNTALRNIRTRWPITPNLVELSSLMRTTTPEDLTEALRLDVSAHLQQPDDFIRLAASQDIPDLFAKQAASIEQIALDKVVFVAVLVNALRIARIHPDATTGVSTAVATGVADLFQEAGIDAAFWRSYRNIALATAIAFARANNSHLTPQSLNSIVPPNMVPRAFHLSYRRNSVHDAPEIVDSNAEYSDQDTPYLAWPVPVSCKACDYKDRMGNFKLRACYAVGVQNGKHCAACVAQHNSFCPERTDGQSTHRGSLKRPSDRSTSEERSSKKRLIDRV